MERHLEPYLCIFIANYNEASQQTTKDGLANSLRMSLIGKKIKIFGRGQNRFDELATITSVGYYFGAGGTLESIKLEVDLKFLDGRRLRFLFFSDEDRMEDSCVIASALAAQDGEENVVLEGGLVDIEVDVICNNLD